VGFKQHLHGSCAEAPHSTLRSRELLLLSSFRYTQYWTLSSLPCCQGKEFIAPAFDIWLENHPFAGDSWLQYQNSCRKSKHVQQQGRQQNVRSKGSV
jgi:hypothetical protein